MNLTTATFKAVLRAEKALYFRTGLKGRILRSFWEYKGARLQKALNREHGTRIEYGYINL